MSPEAPLDGCAPFACGLSTGIGAALNTAQVEPGSTVAVFGCGLVGLGAVIGARLAGAERTMRADHPLMPLYFYVNKHLVKPEVRGWYDNVMNVLYSQDLELVPANTTS